LKTRSLILPVFCLLACHLQAQLIIRGTVVEKDSSSVMPFVYIINKSNGNGTMSDNDGRFYLATHENDTLVCSYVGFGKAYVPVKQLKPNAKGEVRIVMRPLPYNLDVVNVTVFKIKPYEREYMKDIIDRSQVRKLSYFESPFTALYMQYSKEGRQVRKLAAIFEKIMIEEQVQKKLSREILVRLTGDENIDYEAFRKYCFYVSDYYIIEHDGVDLYSRVMDCYKRWKGDMDGENRRRGNYRARDQDPHKAAEQEGKYREH
jgi:hypothetical protein